VVLGRRKERGTSVEEEKKIQKAGSLKSMLL
jgi:hypothetical protein